MASGGERLVKFLARAGVAARRRLERDYLPAGRVQVNGAVVHAPWIRVGPGDEVRVDGRPVRPERPCTLALWKPCGVLSAARDARGRLTVLDLVRGVPGSPRLYPVGRLDGDSEGLLLLTNDGALAHALAHPRHRVPRHYLLLVAPPPSAEDLDRLQRGVRLSDGPARALRARRVPPPACGDAAAGGEGAASASRSDADDRPRAWLELVLTEGRNRQARRMCAALSLEVLRLVRTRVGPVGLDGLAPGRWRRLAAEEVAALRGAAAGGPGRRPSPGPGEAAAGDPGPAAVRRRAPAPARRAAAARGNGPPGPLPERPARAPGAPRDPGGGAAARRPTGSGQDDRPSTAKGRPVAAPASGRRGDARAGEAGRGPLGSPRPDRGAPARRDGAGDSASLPPAAARPRRRRARRPGSGDGRWLR